MFLLGRWVQRIEKRNLLVRMWFSGEVTGTVIDNPEELMISTAE